MGFLSCCVASHTGGLLYMMLITYYSDICCRLLALCWLSSTDPLTEFSSELVYILALLLLVYRYTLWLCYSWYTVYRYTFWLCYSWYTCITDYRWLVSYLGRGRGLNMSFGAKLRYTSLTLVLEFCKGSYDSSQNKCSSLFPVPNIVALGCWKQDAALQIIWWHCRCCWDDEHDRRWWVS